jgi:tRNA dimethylallyltransferase
MNTAQPDAALRASLSTMSLEELRQELTALDPDRLSTIDRKNPRRLIRAIEIARSQKDNPETTMIYHSTPYPPSAVLWIGLTLSKEELQPRIRSRLLERLSHGMLDEARRLHASGLSYERMEELGLEYRYMARHLQGTISYDEMVLQLESEIMKYAKRQMTWFKRNKDIHWFSPSERDAIEKVCRAFLGLRNTAV